MSNIKDGGSAFPQVISDYDDSTHEYMNVHSVGGMTLRDYFAAKAITTLVAFSNDKTYEAEVAETAYRYADAMLKARG
jgi:hypothetical protein